MANVIGSIQTDCSGQLIQHDKPGRKIGLFSSAARLRDWTTEMG